MLRAPTSGPAPWRHPVWLLLIGIGGFLFGIGLLLLGSGQTAQSGEFVRTTGFAVWAAAIGAQTAYWAVIAGPLWTDLAAVWRQARPGRAAMLTLAGTLAVVVIALPIFSAAARVSWPLWGHTMKIRALTIIGGLVAGVPALSGIALVQRQAAERATGRIGEDDVAAALEARSQILRFLSVAGGVIGLAVLAAGALRKATVPEFVANGDFPQEGSCCTEPSSPDSSCWSTVPLMPRSNGWARGSATTISRWRRCRRRTPIPSRAGWTGAPRWRPFSS
jgi:hypothetical protein